MQIEYFPPADVRSGVTALHELRHSFLDQSLGGGGSSFKWFKLVIVGNHDWLFIQSPQPFSATTPPNPRVCDPGDRDCQRTRPTSTVWSCIDDSVANSPPHISLSPPQSEQNVIILSLQEVPTPSSLQALLPRHLLCFPTHYPAPFLRLPARLILTRRRAPLTSTFEDMDASSQPFLASKVFGDTVQTQEWVLPPKLSPNSRIRPNWPFYSHHQGTEGLHRDDRVQRKLCIPIPRLLWSVLWKILTTQSFIFTRFQDRTLPDEFTRAQLSRSPFFRQLTLCVRNLCNVSPSGLDVLLSAKAIHLCSSRLIRHHMVLCERSPDGMAT